MTLYALDQTDAYRNHPQVKQLIKVFFDPRVQPYLKTTTNPQLKDQLSPVAPPEA